MQLLYPEVAKLRVEPKLTENPFFIAEPEKPDYDY